jgi:hypothetical protein
MKASTGMPGQLEFAKVANGVGADGDAHQIIALPGALIG